MNRNVLSFATLSESTLIIRMHFLTSMNSMNYLLFPTTGDCGISYFKVAFKFMSVNTISQDFLIHMYFQSYILDRFSRILNLVKSKWCSRTKIQNYDETLHLLRLCSFSFEHERTFVRYFARKYVHM